MRFFVVVLIVLMTGCTTYHDVYKKQQSEFYAKNTEASTKLNQCLSNSGRKIVERYTGTDIYQSDPMSLFRVFRAEGHSESVHSAAFGKWVQEEAYHVCANEKMMSEFWGRAIAELEERYQRNQDIEILSLGLANHYNHHYH